MGLLTFLEVEHDMQEDDQKGKKKLNGSSKACSNLYKNENSHKRLRFYTFSFPCVFLKHWSLSPPTPPQKEQRKRKTRKWVLGCCFNTLSMGWEKDRPKYLGFELCTSSSKAGPFAPKLNTQGCFKTLSTKVLNGKRMIKTFWVRILLLLLLVSTLPSPPFGGFESISLPISYHVGK
jgi:hypothetical protein